MVDAVEQPVPPLPTNVQSINPYVGLDRGLFVLHGAPNGFARIHAVRSVIKGPGASTGVMQYQVMRYATLPTTAAEYAAGSVLSAPNGTPWFDCLSRGLVADPIVAEYWATVSYLKWYATGGGMLTAVEIDRAEAQAKAFVKTMGSFIGLDEVELETTFMAIEGQPLSRVSQDLSIEYTRNGVSKHIDESNLPTAGFDPVRVALNILKRLP